MDFIGKKAVAGATQQYCRKDGYGNKIQCIYNRKTDRVSWYQSIGGSYMQYENDNLISLFIDKPCTMEEIVNRLQDKIAEIERMEVYINASL